MQQSAPGNTFLESLQYYQPQAYTWVSGNAENPDLNGLIQFYDTAYGGTIIQAEIYGLPYENLLKPTGFYAMHIYEHGDCSGSFENAGMHFNPSGSAHPDHAGDFVPLFGNHGYAWVTFYDERLTIDEIIGRSLIIHANRDDFTTQPFGDSGKKIGCGVIIGLE